MMGRGRGWHGERKRHSDAATRGARTSRGLPTVGRRTPLRKDGWIETCPHDNIRNIHGEWRCGECGENLPAKWKEYHTGGGCMALLLTEPDGSYWLLTDFDDPKLPVRGKPAALGHYLANGMDIGVWRVPRFATPEMAFAARKSFKLIESV